MPDIHYTLIVWYGHYVEVRVLRIAPNQVSHEQASSLLMTPQNSQYLALLAIACIIILFKLALLIETYLIELLIWDLRWRVSWMVILDKPRNVL